MKASASDRSARRDKKKLVNEEIRRGREKGESDRVNLFLIHPCINNGMGEWEGIVLGVPAYTTKNKDFCFCTQLEIRGARWGGKGTGGKYVPALREWWVSFTRTRQNVRSAVSLVLLLYSRGHQGTAKSSRRESAGGYHH